MISTLVYWSVFALAMGVTCSMIAWCFLDIYVRDHARYPWQRKRR